MYKFHGIQELSVGLFARIYIRNATPHLPLDNCMGFAIWMETADGQSVGIEVGNPTTWRGIKGCFTKAHREYLESVQA